MSVLGSIGFLFLSQLLSKTDLLLFKSFLLKLLLSEKFILVNYLCSKSLLLLDLQPDPLHLNLMFILYLEGIDSRQ